ncbi:MAG TPA: response regulator transcription factor [Candidatus Dormibacteraeota bacterium]|jgi:DNA-binding NarL/FixJ family response regulator
MTAAAAESTESVRVLIADDQTLFRSGLARLLATQPGLRIVGEAGNGAEAVRLVERLSPDVVLMDIRMPEVDGIEATRQIVRSRPGVRVLILTSFHTDAYVLEALRSGASGYVLKDSAVEAIASSIQAVLSSERVISGPIAQRMIGMLTGETPTREFYDGLTAREVEVLKMIASGMPNKRIAYKLGISEKTIRNHISHIYEKLQIYDRSQAVLYAVRKGLVDL